MKIFLLLKNMEYQLLIKQILNKIILDRDWQASEIVTIDNGENIDFSKEELHCIYFIDTEDSGFLLAQKIRRYDFRSTLCFFYKNEEELIESYWYKIEAFDFINKQQSKEKTFYKIEEVLLEIQNIYFLN